MAAAEAEDTLQWVSLHEAAIRLAERSAADQKPLAAYAVEQQFRDGYRYRYRDGSALHENDLPPDFLREAVINVAASTATQGERTERIPNPDLPLVRGDCTPQAQWIPSGPCPFSHDPFSHPAYIEKTVPAKTVTDIEVLVPKPSEPPGVEQVAQTAPRPGRPSSAPLVLEEAERRLRSSDRENFIRRGRENFLKGLSDWLCDTHPKARSMAPKTIGDRLRGNPNVRAHMPKDWHRRT